MSLFSQFGDSANIGSVPSVRCRSRLLTGTFSSYSGAFSAFGYSISDTPSYLVFAEGFGNLLRRTNFFTVDLLTGKITTKNGPVKTNPGNTQPIVVNPINGGIITNDPTAASSNAQQSLDGGSTWSTIWSSGFGLNNGNSFPGAGWFDGTTFILHDAGGNTYRTTNGTSFSSGSLIGDGPILAGNNRSAYSGYWFSWNASTGQYKYRTSLGGSDVSVTGYYLASMSMNGRYLVRVNGSTFAYEYSTDGGASWSAFSTASYIPLSANTNVPHCFNDGSFWMVGISGSLFYYDFSTNLWTSYNSLETTSVVQTTMYFRGGAGSEECLVSQAPYTNGGVKGVLLVDRPRIPV